MNQDDSVGASALGGVGETAAAAGLKADRRIPDLSDPNIHPPTVAESGDSFAALRIVHLLARVPRGKPIPIRDLVARLNADYLGWLFSPVVVADAVLQLQSNWMADYRTVEGIRLVEDPSGPAIEIEDTPRVDPWMVAQVDRLAAECRDRLREFARGEGRGTEG